MSVLTVAQQVSLSVGIGRPLTVFASTSREGQEMQAVANEAAAVIADAFDWQALLRVQMFTGTGSSESFDLPDDYRRMQENASLWSSRYRADIRHIVSTDEWLSLDVYPIGDTFGVWTIFGGKMHVRPVMSAGETVRFFYVSNALSSSGPTFTNDTDIFALDERLLKLCMIYLWKQEKGQDFTAELSDFEMALDKARNRDAGSKPVLSGNVGGSRNRRGGNVWPGSVSGAA